MRYTNRRLPLPFRLLLFHLLSPYPVSEEHGELVLGLIYTDANYSLRRVHASIHE